MENIYFKTIQIILKLMSLKLIFDYIVIVMTVTTTSVNVYKMLQMAKLKTSEPTSVGPYIISVINGIILLCFAILHNLRVLIINYTVNIILYLLTLMQIIYYLEK